MFKRVILSTFFSILFLIGLVLIDFKIITPAILPEDHCYYHFHPTPWWVEFLYMSPGSNGHPDGSFTHLFLLLGISIVLGVLSAKLIFKKRQNS